MKSQLEITHLEQQITQIVLTNPDSELILLKIAELLGSAFQVDYCLICTTTQIVGWPSPLQVDQMSWLQISELGQQLLTMLITNPELDHELWEVNDLKTTTIADFRLECGANLPIRRILGSATRFLSKINGGIFLMLSRGVDLGRKNSRSRKSSQKNQVREWTELEKKQLKHLTNQVSLAILPVVQKQAIAEAEQKLHSSRQHQQMIGQLTRAILNSEDLNQIFTLAIDGTATALEVERSLLLMLKYNETVFSSSLIPHAKVTVAQEWSKNVKTATVGKRKQYQNQNKSFWLSECHLCKTVFSDPSTPVAIADQQELITTEPEIKIADIFTWELMPIILLIPLLGGINSGSGQSKVLGFLAWQQSQPRPWQTEELEFVKLVAALISIAIIHNQTNRHFSALVEDRTIQLQGSLAVQAKLYEKVRQQVDQLRQLNQLKDEFVSTMSHELRTPLTSMNLAIRMLRQPGISPERTMRYLDILEQQCNQEINLVNDLLALQQFESQQAQIQIETLELKDLIREITIPLIQKWQENGISLCVDVPTRSLKIQTDRDSLTRLLLELLTNAGKYSDPGTTVILKAIHQVDEQINQMVISLTNIGQGIAPTELPHIFDKFRRGKDATKQAIQGTGLGLALVKCLVQHLNGTITVTSNPLENSSSYETCFTLCLPHLVDRSKA